MATARRQQRPERGSLGAWFCPAAPTTPFPSRSPPTTYASSPTMTRRTGLLVAGYTGSKEDFPPLLAPMAAAGLRAVAIDQRGQFESPGPDDPAEYSIDALADDVLAVARLLRA